MLVSFVPPGGGAACVGLLSADGGRIADLTAIGMEDVYAALPRAAQLERLAVHLTKTPGAVVYDVGSVRLLAPVPYARLVRSAAALVTGAGDAGALRFDEPREIAGPGARIGVAAGELLAVGVMAVIATGGRDIAPADGAAHLAGVTLFAEWRSGDPDGAIAIDRLAAGPAIAPMSSLESGELLVTMPGESVRRIPLAGAREALGAAVAAASALYTLRAGDAFLHDAGVMDAPLERGGHAEIVMEGPSGALSHVATRTS